LSCQEIEFIIIESVIDKRDSGGTRQINVFKYLEEMEKILDERKKG
jgi:hypothetical protein